MKSWPRLSIWVPQIVPRRLFEEFQDISGFFYCFSESLKCSCVSNNCYGRYLKSSRMFQFFFIVPASLWTDLAFLKIVTAGIWRVPQDVSGFFIIPASFWSALAFLKNRYGESLIFGATYQAFNYLFGVLRVFLKLFQRVIQDVSPPVKIVPVDFWIYP